MKINYFVASAIILAMSVFPAQANDGAAIAGGVIAGAIIGGILAPPHPVYVQPRIYVDPVIPRVYDQNSCWPHAIVYRDSYGNLHRRRVCD